MAYDTLPASAILAAMSDDPVHNGGPCPPSASLGERRNLELKARLDSLPTARTVAQRLATDRLASQIQIDTYFCCGHGRLKLREIDGGPSQLVSYVRPDRCDVALSQYHLVEVPDGSSLKQAHFCMESLEMHARALTLAKGGQL